MSDDTTTNVEDNPQADESSQPEEGSIQASAESQRSGPVQDTEAQNKEEPETGEEEPAEDNSEEHAEEEQQEDVSDEDTELAEMREWAEKKGIDPNDTKAVLKAARDADRGFHEYANKQKEKKEDTDHLYKQVKDNSDYSDNDVVMAEARLINFYNRNPEANDYDMEMGDIYGRFAKSDPSFADHLLRYPETLLAMAKNESTPAKVQKAREEGKNEVIAKQKKATAASSPKTTASASKPQESGWTEDKVNKVLADPIKYEKEFEELKEMERQSFFNQ